jgi:hypothetical protein
VGLHTDHGAFVLAGVWPQASDVIGVVDVKQLPLGTSLEELGTSLEEVAGEAAKIARDNRALAVFEATIAALLPASWRRDCPNRR